MDLRFNRFEIQLLDIPSVGGSSVFVVNSYELRLM